ncbi:hypothetical protein B296_00019303 [Ensete ventricosum]|uniref:Tryptophanyl-tRNA synthetase n=1 Tax=Ensete ventricosum TaxID=4639 RepID=A0A426YXD5_ENSVE|nr:hypothetical protein B296_00019303 [Ensete ventricosum]
MVEEPTKAGFAGGGDREGEDEQVVNPWEVTAKDGGKIDYDKLIEKFGCQRLDESLVRRVERLTGRPAHVFLRRGVFFAHRSGSLVLGWFLIGTSMRFLMSMRGARSSSCTRGEGRPPRRCIWGIWCPSCSLSRYPCRIGEEQCTGNMFLPLLLLPLLLSLSIDRRRSILEVSPSSGWSAYRSAGKPVCIARYGALSLGKANLGLGSIAFYENMVKVAKCVTFNKIFLPYLNIIYCLQAVPSFPSSFPHLFSGKDNLRCLIPCAIDQVFCFLLLVLQLKSSHNSSGVTFLLFPLVQNCICSIVSFTFLFITYQLSLMLVVIWSIFQDPYFRMTRDVAPRIGYQKPALIESSFFPALQVDIPVKYLGFFLEDDAELDHIKKEYGAGRMLTGEVKKRLVEVLSELVERHRMARALVTDEVSN